MSSCWLLVKLASKLRNLCKVGCASKKLPVLTGERIFVKTERQSIHILCEELSETWPMKV